MTNNKIAKIGLVSVSDRASAGVYADKGLPSLKAWLEKVLLSPFEVTERLIPDEAETIAATLAGLCDVERCDLILTTGGTGPSRRDVTPEATEAVCTRIMPGFGEKMRAISSVFVPTAILSRQLAGLREIEGHAALIINLPGQPKAIAETLEGLPAKGVDGIFAAVPYCLELIGGPSLETDPLYVKAFRPKSAARPHIIDSLVDEPQEKADSTIIMLHGLGTDGSDFQGFREELAGAGAEIASTRIICPNAPVRPISMNGGYPMRGWFDMHSTENIDREDLAGMEDSWKIIRRLIAEEESRGISRSRILLGGFSQGGTVSLYSALRMPYAIGGIFCLSAYLPAMGATFNPENHGLDSPIFVGHGIEDDVVAYPFAEMSVKKLRELGAPKLEDHGYEGCGHFLCAEELKDLAGFINRVLK
jgi:molybdenum cofactor synthesis domain-containing protein